MGNNASKWLLGCGIGCVVLIAILVLVGLGSFFLVKDTIEDFEEMGATVAQVRDAHGEPEAYAPEPGGTPTSERIEAFLEVRASTLAVREDLTKALETALSSIDTMEDEGGSFFGILRIIGVGAGALPKVAAFHRVRAQALLEEEMGLGEYSFYYVLIYYSWLGKSPSDGPPFTLVGRGQDNDGSESEEVVRERRRQQIQRNMRRLFISFLENGLEECERLAEQGSEVWCDTLLSELEALQSDSDRMPFQEGPPPGFEKVLADYREDLAASYSELLNPLELAELVDD